jgi:DNA repair exonuclease SbcCD nuclease subunit
MKLLVLSDLFWNKEAKAITIADIKKYSENKIVSKKFASLEIYNSIIKNEKPNIVLLAGDITGDGSCGHGFQNALLLFCTLLEKKRINTFFIKGNHDLPRYFNLFLEKTKTLKYVNYISGKKIKCKGITITGLDFELTKKASLINNLRSTSGSSKIILAHCQSERRYSLFHFQTEYIITGHAKQILSQVKDKTYISLDNDINADMSYCTIEFTPSKETISYYNLDNNTTDQNVTRALKNGLKLKFIEKGLNYYDIHEFYEDDNKARRKYGFSTHY